MPNAAPSARYDLPWKAAVTHAFRPFMDFYFSDFSAHIDWRQRPRFRDKELAGFGLGAAPDVMVADMLVEVRMLHGRQRRMLLHIEIQAQRDTTLAQRVHDYNYRIGKAYGLPVTSLVLLADAVPSWRPDCFHEPGRGSARTFSFTTAKLLDYASDLDALAASHNPVAWVTLAHVLTQLAHHDPDALYAAKLRATKLLFQHRWKSRRIMLLFDVVNWMIVLPESYQRRYWRAVLRLQKEHEMKLLNPLEQMFFDDGVKRGLKQGLEQGRMKGAAALLERQLMQRFGPLPQTARKKLARASVEQVEAWSDALAEAQSLKQVFKGA